MGSAANQEYTWVFTPELCKLVLSQQDADSVPPQELFQAILDSIQDGVSVLSRTLTIQYVNNAMKHWYNQDVIVTGKKCYKLFHDCPSPCENCPSIRAIENRKPESELVCFQKARGQTTGWQQLFSVPVMDVNGEVILIIEYVRDVTDRKSAEMQFENLENQNEVLLAALHQHGQDKENLEETIVSNVERFIKPSLNYLKKLVNGKDVDMVNQLIDEIVNTLTQKRPTAIGTLTPRELQVAKLIKGGSTSKEIADQLYISKKAVDYHRTNIRKKLQLAHDNNLQIYLDAHL
ncbi:LuxR C-terminal-related transcriptional regulator [Ethanoligenens sp.]|uniref:LuxR C-terminal-related transcriptional regulator n=1 Tax=Ethanoligenens sp. TaxID=2099655 RepID=UPI0039ED9AA7